MPEIHYQQYPTYEPMLGAPIRAIEIAHDNIFITDDYKRVYQIWINFDGHPNIQLVKA